MNSLEKMNAPVAEPLEDLAWLAFENAPHTCNPEYGCGPYHQMWSLTRLLTRDGKPPRGLSFFAKHLAELGKNGETVRILLAGSADCGLPTLLANAAFAAGRVPSITVVDRCASPLAQIDALAERTGLDITTHQGDLNDVEHDSFDAAVTHNVMLFSPNDLRKVIYRKLADGLREGGRLLSTETICDRVSPRDADDIGARMAAVVKSVDERGLSAADTSQVMEAAHAFLTTQRRVSAYSEKDLRQHILGTGLTLLSFDALSREASNSPRVKKVDEEERTYAFIAAQKLS